MKSLEGVKEERGCNPLVGATHHAEYQGLIGSSAKSKVVNEVDRKEWEKYVGTKLVKRFPIYYI